ncbi:MAG: hypothetical protein LUE12_07370 [Ruminococcus sp.]|nr:hypothetical protein [Ruminococcus sp.]
MNSTGVINSVIYNGSVYYFETLKFTIANKVEDSALIDGDLYRIKAASASEIIYLKTRISHSKIFTYRALLKSLAQNVSSIRINATLFSNLTLMTGKISSPESEEFATCEITLTEVEA